MDALFTRLIACVATAWALTWLTSGVGMAQDLGQVFVHVTDQSGEIVTDLSRDDFTVSEGGVPSGVVSAELATEPMKIALLVDNSTLVNQGGALTSLREGLDAFLTVLPGQHEVGLATIGQNLRWRVDFTTDRVELKETAGEIFVAGGAGPILLDGIKETWERRFEDEESWPIFVVVTTDGAESSGRMNQNEYANLVNDLMANGVTVHILLLSSGGSGVTEYAINLTDNTGGLYEVFGAATRFSTALPELATKLGANYDQVSQRYRVLYERPDPPGTSLSIGVVRPGLVARPYIDRRIEP